MCLSYAGDGSEDEGGGDHGAGFAASSKSPPHFLALLRFNSVRFERVQAAPANRIVVVGLSFSPEISAGVCTRVSSWACSLLVQIGVDSSIIGGGPRSSCRRDMRYGGRRSDVCVRNWEEVGRRAIRWKGKIVQGGKIQEVYTLQVDLR